jgi:hypothetical protein
MPAPAWLTYVGAITGIVGTCTGIAGAVISYVNHRRVSRVKALDLRLELRKLAVGEPNISPARRRRRTGLHLYGVEQLIS